jgi:hypothetical protein
MYRCDKCGKNTESGQKRLAVTIELREVTYLNNTQGLEIVKEQKVCRSCAGLPALPAKVVIYSKSAPVPIGSFCLQLGDGKEVTSDKGVELAFFLESRGRRIVAGKGGKSKGARKPRK